MESLTEIAEKKGRVAMNYYIVACCKIPELSTPKVHFHTIFYWFGDLDDLCVRDEWLDNKRKWFSNLEDAEIVFEYLKVRYPNASLKIMSSIEDIVKEN